MFSRSPDSKNVYHHWAKSTSACKSKMAVANRTYNCISVTRSYINEIPAVNYTFWRSPDSKKWVATSGDIALWRYKNRIQFSTSILDLQAEVDVAIWHHPYLNWIGRHQKHINDRCWNSVDLATRYEVATISGFRQPSWICKRKFLPPDVTIRFFEADDLKNT
jgi:hypothetical protein